MLFLLKNIVNFPQLQRYESDMSSSVRLDTSSMNTSFKTKNTFGFTNGKKIILCDNPISEKSKLLSLTKLRLDRFRWNLSWRK